MTNILDIIQADYAKFPEAQTYSIYSEDVYFKDPDGQVIEIAEVIS